MLKLILARAQEPSTYAGISALLVAIGVNVPQEKLKAVSTALAALAGVAAAFMAEKGSGTPPVNP